jgi:hypothetical protein
VRKAPRRGSHARPKRGRSERQPDRDWNAFERELLKHQDQVLARLVLCCEQIRAVAETGNRVDHAGVAKVLKEHWPSVLKELAASARVFRRQAAAQDAAGYEVEATILRAIADRFVQPNVRLMEALQLMKWLSVPVTLSHAETQFSAVRTIVRLPLLTATEKNKLTKQVYTKRGRAPATRNCAARALEMRRRGFDWPTIERALLPGRRDPGNPGQAVRRQAQHLSTFLKQIGVSLPPTATHPAHH